jgi:hypothetical protein
VGDIHILDFCKEFGREHHALCTFKGVFYMCVSGCPTTLATTSIATRKEL